MLRESKEIAINVVSTAVVMGVGLAFLGGIGLIVAREAYRDWKDEKIKPRKLWNEKKWPERVRSTLVGKGKGKTGLDVL